MTSVNLEHQVKITTPEQLDRLPLGSVVACVSHMLNVPVCIVFQRGSLEHGGDGWCSPDALGQIPSAMVFEFIGLNGFPPELIIFYTPGL